MQHFDRIALGDVGSVAFSIQPAGIALDQLITSPGWIVALQRPKGRFGRKARKPADALIVILRDGLEQYAREWELEIGRLDDGTWEHAVREQWQGDADQPVATPAGVVHTSTRDGNLVLVSAQAQDGWAQRHESHIGDEVVVVFSRGTEDWEVVVLVDHTGHDPTIIEREHRWRIGPLTR